MKRRHFRREGNDGFTLNKGGVAEREFGGAPLERERDTGGPAGKSEDA